MAYFSSSKKGTAVTLLALGLFIFLVAAFTYYIHERRVAEKLNEANLTLFNVGEGASYVDMQGNPLSLDSYRGSILIVNAWASWSPYAVDELPLLQKVAADYADRQVVVLAINRKEDRTQAERFLNTLPPLPLVKIVVDQTDFFYGATGGYAMPETLIYNQAGTLVNHIRGTLNDESIRSELDSLVQSR